MNRVERSLMAERKRLEDRQYLLNVKLADVNDSINRIDKALDALKAEKQD